MTPYLKAKSDRYERRKKNRARRRREKVQADAKRDFLIALYRRRFDLEKNAAILRGMELVVVS